VELQIELGVDPELAAKGDLRFSEHLIIAFTTEALAGHAVLPAGSGPVVMVGPSMVGAGADDPRYRTDGFPMEWLEGGGKKILISLGTVNVDAGKRFLTAGVEAMTGSGIRAVMVAPPELLGPLPPEVLARPRIPQLAVLDRVDAVVCHAGHNTVCESLARGLPLVVAPIRDDQPVVADQVVRAGAGIRLRFGRCRAADIAGAVTAVLDDGDFREAAVRIQRSFEAAGGAPVAADHLEALQR
jgi:MGT family glycosyltransferase